MCTAILNAMVLPTVSYTYMDEEALPLIPITGWTTVPHSNNAIICLPEHIRARLQMPTNA